MKKLILCFLLLSNLITSNSFAFDAAVKGFIAIDALNFVRSNSIDSTDIGIGTLDLKVFAEQDNMSAALKLAIKSNLNVPGNLFEQAYASYRGVPNWKFSAGKGQINFQNLHWGVGLNTYQDGGSILGTENSWRKVYNKAFVSAAYGKRDWGYLDTLSLYGDSGDIVTNDQGQVKYVQTSGVVTGYSLATAPTFTIEKQLGIANKFELFKIDQWVINTSQIYYKNKLQPKPSYAFDVGFVRNDSLVEIWMDMIYGFTSKAPYEAYTTFAKHEFFVQLGTEYHLNEFWSLKANTEYLHTIDQAHTYTTYFYDSGTKYTNSSDNLAKSGQNVIATSYKLDVGAQYLLSKTSFLTFAAIYETKRADRNGVKSLSIIPGVTNPNAEGFELGAFIAFWF